MDFDLSIPTKVISGENCVRKNGEKFAFLGKSCIIITGGKSAKLSGALDDVSAVLDENDISYVIYDKIEPNPLLSSCFEAGRIARDIHANFVVGIGGGSALDAAKAVAVYASNGDFSVDDIYTAKSRNRALPLVLIGTTAGTGSEIGRVSVLTNDKTGRKKSISPDDCYPTLTFADSRYTHSMPYGVTVSTALDAFAHVIEGYFSVKCGDIPTLFGEKAIVLIWDGLKALHQSKRLPDASLREQLYYGSLYAGITLAYCGTAFPHPLGYVLTENYGVAHGTACAVFMPDFLKRAQRFEKDKFSRLLELTGESSESMCKAIKDLTDCKGIAMTAEQIEKYCSRWDEAIPANFKFSPGGFTKADAKQLFEEKFLKL